MFHVHKLSNPIVRASLRHASSNLSWLKSLKKTVLLFGGSTGGYVIFKIATPLSINEQNKVNFEEAIQLDLKAAPLVKDTPEESKMTSATHQDREHSVYETAKLFISSFTLLPLRIILLTPLLIMTYVCAKISTIGLSNEYNNGIHEPPIRSRWRRMAAYPIKWLARTALFVIGFHYIDRKGTCTSDPSAYIVVSNHVSMVDPLLMMSELCPSYVAKADIAKVPVIGTVARAVQAIMVDRKDGNSRKNVAKEIHRRARHQSRISSHSLVGSYPKLVIFPEGTTTNGKCLIKFKYGSFRPGCPIQPVVIQYPYKHFNPAFTTTHTDYERNKLSYTSELYLVWRLLCQFENYVNLKYLPVYYPNDTEKENPKSFAQSVEKYMAEFLSLPIVDAKFY